MFRIFYIFFFFKFTLGLRVYLHVSVSKTLYLGETLHEYQNTLKQIIKLFVSEYTAWTYEEVW